MDLGEKDDMYDYEKINRMIESTYKNILKNFNPGVKQLIVLGKALQKTIQNVGTSLKAYNECLHELARSAESCKGSTNELGLGLLQLTDSQNQINQQLSDSIKVFHAELLIPLKAKQENEFRHVQVIYDKYLAGHKYHSNNLRKAQNVVERYKKKSKSKSGQKEMEKTRHMKESKRKLEEFLRKNLRLALLEERKRYCYLFNRLLCVVEDRVSKFTKANDLLTEGLQNWPKLCRSPHILPTATEQVMHDFGFSDDSCDVEDEPSGDGDHGEAKAHPRPLKHDSLPGYDWSGRTTSSSVAAAIEEMQRKHSATLTPTTRRFETRDDEVKLQTTPGILCAVYPYVAATETQLSLETNDVIRVHGDVQNGWLYGRNIRTEKEGWFPLSFTDFNEELLQWKKDHLSQLQSSPQNKNANLSNVRKTWHTEVGYSSERRPSRFSESDASDATMASAAAIAADTATTATVTVPIYTRPMSYCTTVPSPEAVDQQLIRTKCLNRRTLEPISENIPPPEEFRDRINEANVAEHPVYTVTNNFEPVTQVSLAEEQTPEEWVAGKQTSSDVTKTEDATEAATVRAVENQTENKSRVATQRPTEELHTEDELPPLEVASGGGSCFIFQQTDPIALPPPPSPLPPLPPLTLSASAGALFTRLPRYTNNSASAALVRTDYSISSNVVNSGGSNEGNNARDNAGNIAGSDEGNSSFVSSGIKARAYEGDNGSSQEGNSGAANGGDHGIARVGSSASAKRVPSIVLTKAPVTADSSSAAQTPTPPPPPRPPPPPPPLPPGSYRSVRGEGFARPRLRKTTSMDSTKTT